mmetsp:Transcript_5539/g.15655  ORF Transcript_5539/g.15655 Transcript_5539/m.15655 type:complete len:298 (-) Transcript_5539:1385-2278(-)
MAYAEFQPLCADPRFRVGDAVPDASVAAALRTAEAPLHPLISADVLEFAAPPDAAPAWLLEFNRKRKGWHYGWTANKHSCNTEHCLRVYVLTRGPGDAAMVCSDVIQSSPFVLFCRRRRRFVKFAEGEEEAPLEDGPEMHFAPDLPGLEIAALELGGVKRERDADHDEAQGSSPSKRRGLPQEPLFLDHSALAPHGQHPPQEEQRQAGLHNQQPQSMPQFQLPHKKRALYASLPPPPCDSDSEASAATDCANVASDDQEDMNEMAHCLMSFAKHAAAVSGAALLASASPSALPFAAA